MTVEGTAGVPGRASKRPETLLWFSRRIGEICGLSSRAERLSASLTTLHTDSFPTLLPHRLTAEILVTYGEVKSADAAEAKLCEIMGKRGPTWELEAISDRPPMKERRSNRRLARALQEAAERWSLPFEIQSSVSPSVAGLASGSTAIVCGMGPAALNLYTPHEAVQRISVLQRALLLTQFLLRDGRRE